MRYASLFFRDLLLSIVLIGVIVALGYSVGFGIYLVSTLSYLELTIGWVLTLIATLPALAFILGLFYPFP